MSVMSSPWNAGLLVSSPYLSAKVRREVVEFETSLFSRVVYPRDVTVNLKLFMRLEGKTDANSSHLMKRSD